MPNQTFAHPIEVKPFSIRGPTGSLEGLVRTSSEMDPSVIDLLRDLRNGEPDYPSIGQKGTIEYVADVVYHDIRGGGDLIDVTHYDSKDFGHRKSVALQQGKRRIVGKLDSYSRRIGFSIMDVEGKGPAALHTALKVNNVMKAHNNRDFEQYGEVTSHAIEHLNDHFYSLDKRKVSFTYGEVTELAKPRKDGVTAICRFISAGGLLPKIYRKSLNAFDSDVQNQWTSGWLLGVARSDQLPDSRKSEKNTMFKEAYVINQFELFDGDIGMFFTDGYSEPGARGKRVYPLTRAEGIMRENSNPSLQQIHSKLLVDRMDYTDWPINDDLGMLLVRQSSRRV